jgi:hypothetical protein
VQACRQPAMSGRGAEQGIASPKPRWQYNQ